MQKITFQSDYHGRKTGRFGDPEHGYYWLRRSAYTGNYYRYSWNPAFKRHFNNHQQAEIDRFAAASRACNSLWNNVIEKKRISALFERYKHIQSLHPTWQKETVLYVMGVISELPKWGKNSRKRAKNPYYRTAKQLCMSICYLHGDKTNKIHLTERANTCAYEQKVAPSHEFCTSFLIKKQKNVPISCISEKKVVILHAIRQIRGNSPIRQPYNKQTQIT